MTTGRINQVTLVKRAGKKDRSLARSLKKSSSFSSPEQQTSCCLDQEVL
jgi:hypothetical protein